jgi:hypothetical protein
MRIWSLHPKYLDRKGLLACWRETLLAQRVLRKATGGYQNHPQLIRFICSPHPLTSIATYLVSLADEADRRGFSFNRSKIESGRANWKIDVTQGQIMYEWAHFKGKLSRRDPQWLERLPENELPDCHPLFQIVPGDVEKLEKIPG